MHVSLLKQFPPSLIFPEIHYNIDNFSKLLISYMLPSLTTFQYDIVSFLLNIIPNSFLLSEV